MTELYLVLIIELISPHLCLLQDGALTAFRKTYDKTVALGHRLDIVFYLLRIGLFYMDNDLITRNTEKAKRYCFIKTLMNVISAVLLSKCHQSANK